MTSEQLMQAVLHGAPPVQRRAMAKTITLLESTCADHRVRADALLQDLLPHTGNALRLGISGAPGVGKSTFIEALGLYLIAQGQRVAVLAIDPSSTLSGGAILGDKTRMERLSMHRQAYIRPSPSSGTLGGVAERTRETMLVCEAAGYDVVLVETVGVGQSETMVANMTDVFVLMQLPNAGDDLQAMKKGVMELADLVLINKADIDLTAAKRAQAYIASALRGGAASARPSNPHPPTNMQTSQQAWFPKVLLLSALNGTGIEDFWQALSIFVQLQHTKGAWQCKRKQQNLDWMWERIQAGLRKAFLEHAAVHALLPELSEAVQQGQMLAPLAAQAALQAAQSAGAATAQ